MESPVQTTANRSLDRVVFARVMGGFADRIGRALAPVTAEMYYDVLNAALTTGEFIIGARIVFRTHEYNTWPNPQQFIDAAKPPAATALDAAEAFERVLHLANQPQRAWNDRQAAILALGPVVERAFRAVGGRRELDNILVDHVAFARKRFIAAYELAEEAARHEADIAATREAIGAGAPHLRLEDMDHGAQLVVRGLAEMKSLGAGRNGR